MGGAKGYTQGQRMGLPQARTRLLDTQGGGVETRGSRGKMAEASEERRRSMPRDRVEITARALREHEGAPRTRRERGRLWGCIRGQSGVRVCERLDHRLSVARRRTISRRLCAGTEAQAGRAEALLIAFQVRIGAGGQG